MGRQDLFGRGALVRDIAVPQRPEVDAGARDACQQSVRAGAGLDDNQARTAIRRFCNERLESYKVPVKIRFVEGPLSGDRQKRVRIGRDAGPDAWTD